MYLRVEGGNAVVDHYLLGVAEITDYTVGGFPVCQINLSQFKSRLRKTYSLAFKIGLLRFEERDQSDIYAELRIDGWQDILTDQDIETLLLSPTMEGLQKIINIQNDAYFERVRGVFLGLKSTGADLSTKVETIITKRYKELMDRKRVSEIHLTPVVKRDEQGETKAELEAMRAQMAAMQEMLVKLQSQPTKQADAQPVKKTSAKAKAPAAN